MYFSILFKLSIYFFKNFTYIVLYMKKESKLIIFLMVILSLFGIIMIYSASSIWADYKFNDSMHYAKLQFIFFIISLFVLFILLKIKPKFYQKNANLFLLIAFILLIIVLIPGIGTIRNGSRSWFNLGPLSMQPSELSKIALIIFLAKYLSNNQKNMQNFKKGLLPILSVIAIFFGLIMLEPDFGSAMVIVLTLMIIIFISGVKLSFFASLGIIGLLGITGLIIVAPYRLERIFAFLNPWSDPLGSGFQIIQSLYAIGPGGLFGLGFGNSIQKQFYLPEPQTDFIFSIISEEFGFMGILIITLIFGLIFYLICKIALKQNDLFKKYLAFGLGIQIILQALLNLCVVVGLIPVTGVTLPFLSYGGSSLLVSVLSIGIIVSINEH